MPGFRSIENGQPRPRESPPVVSTPTKRTPLQRVTESKINADLGNLYSGAVRVLQKNQSPKKMQRGKAHSETHYMQPTESSRFHVTSTPKRNIGTPPPPRLQTPSRTQSPGNHATPCHPRTPHTPHSPSARTPREFVTPPHSSKSERETISSEGRRPKLGSKINSSRADVFARLTQGLPTRHTAPPASGPARSARSLSNGKGKKVAKISSETKSPSGQKNYDVIQFSSQSLLRNSHNVLSGSEIGNKSVHDERPTRSLTSQLLLPSPPRNFFSGIPEPPPQKFAEDEREDFRLYMQNLRDLVDDGNAVNDTTADSELTNNTTTPYSPSQYQQLKLFSEELSIVEECESRSSSPRSLMSGSAWTMISETIRPPFVDYQNERNIVMDVKPKECMSQVSEKKIDRKPFLDQQLKEELSKSVTLTIPRDDGLLDVPNDEPKFLACRSLSTTFSTCLSPTNTSNTLDQSFYISQFDNSCDQIRRRDSGLHSEVSSDSAFFMSGESMIGGIWNSGDRTTEPIARHLENIDEEETENITNMTSVLWDPPPPPSFLIPE